MAIRQVRAATGAPFAANVFTHPTPRLDQPRADAFLAELQPLFAAAGGRAPSVLREIYRSFNDDDEMLQMLIEERPAVVSLHFGPASEGRMRALIEAGISVLATATSVTEAKVLEATGVTAIVVQGFDAGGHSGAFLGPPDPSTSGRAGLLTLVHEIAAAVRVPLVAAGGLMTGADVRQVIEGGAAGAQLGTAFIGCPESLAGALYKGCLGSGASTRLTSAISGRPARGLDNALMARMAALEAPVPDYPFTYDAVKQLIAAVGEPEFSVMWAGTGAALIRPMAAADLVGQFVSELGSEIDS